MTSLSLLGMLIIVLAGWAVKPPLTVVPTYAGMTVGVACGKDGCYMRQPSPQ